MAEPSEEVAFTQEDYNAMIAALDGVMSRMKDRFGKTEAEAAEWLKDFIDHHYFGVWRKISR